MIVTVTANPSVDRTVVLDGPLRPGGVHRLSGATIEAGGKGVNVARVVHMAGRPVCAVLPSADSDPMTRLLTDIGLPHRRAAASGRVRMNLTITEPDGTTTKLNEPGTALSPSQINALTELVLAEGQHATWVVLSGSLPPGFPVDWYARLVPRLKDHGVSVVVDTSDAPLAALAASLPDAAPDLLKPNAEELAQLSGICVTDLEAGGVDCGAAIHAASVLIERGVGSVLATLGSAGAVLVGEGYAFSAATAPITVRSTVGAGDAALAGYLLAAETGCSPDERLSLAVAYGAAAASLPGSALPRPDQIDRSAVVIRPSIRS